MSGDRGEGITLAALFLPPLLLLTLLLVLLLLLLLCGRLQRPAPALTLEEGTLLLQEAAVGILAVTTPRRCCNGSMVPD
jgi:Tfp pilus assembly protein PilN